MTRKGWIVAIVLVVVVNGIVLFGAARNRSGERDATVVLTERELPFGFMPDENTGILLELKWNRDWQGLDWLDADKLGALGFDCSVPVDATSKEFHYDKQLPRRAFVVLEYEGDAWERWLAKREREFAELAEDVENGKATTKELEDKREILARDRRTRSRLEAVDAGTDPGALRSRYTDRSRFIVAPGVIDIFVDRSWGEPPELRGRVTEILVGRIHVSREHRSLLEPFRESTDPNDDPRYRVTVAFGSRYEPWIVEASALAEGEGP